jgi:hypothetical protein
MRIPRPLAWFAVVLLAVGLGAGCGGGGGGGSTGTLALSATDGPFPATEGCLSAALIDVDRASVQRVDGEEGWLDLPLVGAVDGVLTLDLLQLRSGLEEALAVGLLPTGTYHQIRLHLLAARLQFTDGSPERSFTVPSGMQSGLKINVNPSFVIAAGQTTPILIDFDLARSFHVTANGGEPDCDDLKSGSGTTMFDPVVHAMNVDTTGVVAGTVSDATPAPVADVEVSAFPAGTVVDATTVPTATTFSAPDGLLNAPLGSYAMRLEPGSYDLYVRAQDATDRTLAASAVVVTAGQITTQDLSLPAP